MKATLALLLATVFLSGCHFVLPTPKTSFTTHKGTVLKVYTATDAGHAFIAYAVDHGGAEVIVSDPLARSSHKTGDAIEYMAQKIDISGHSKSLSFTLLK